MLKSQVKFGWVIGLLCTLAAMVSGCDLLGEQDVYYVLEINGKVAGTVTEFEIDDSAAAASQAHPVSFKTDKLSGALAFEWIRDELASDLVVDQGGTVERKSVSIIYLNDTGEETRRVNLGKTQIDVFSLQMLRADGTLPLLIQLRVYPEKIEQLDQSRLASPEAVAAAKLRAATKTQGDFNLASKFALEIDSVIVGGVHHVDGLEHEHEIVEYRDGDDMTVHFRPGRQKPGRIVITKDWSNTSERSAWQQWFESSQNGAPIERKSVSIIFHNDAGEESMRVNLFDCWPTKWKGPALDARNSAHATEVIEIMSERMELK